MNIETHTQMVSRLVKWGDDAGFDIHHAVTGICGEVIELRAAGTAENEREELGDLVFYIKHLKLALDRWGFDLPSVLHYPMVTRATVDELLLKSSGDLLDYGKKCWVYRKDPNQLTSKIAIALSDLEKALEFKLRQLGYELSEIEHGNQEKLSTGPNARYPLGYSDAAAQARADKTGEAG